MGLPLVNQFLAQGYALVRILSALKIKPSTYYNWRRWQPSRQGKRRESLRPYILDVWKTFKFYGYRRIAAYSQQIDGPKVSEYMTLKLMREEVYLKAYQTLTEVQAAIGWYINFYNRNRISNVA
ncbi:transposase [Leuconostoc lactis]|nr:transposase [Leuconostoc lactis]